MIDHIVVDTDPINRVAKPVTNTEPAATAEHGTTRNNASVPFAMPRVTTATNALTRDLPRHAAVDEGQAADQNGTRPTSRFDRRLSPHARPGCARPQVALTLSSARDDI
jgi:hypothetical protein